MDITPHQQLVLVISCALFPPCFTFLRPASSYAPPPVHWVITNPHCASSILCVVSKSANVWESSFGNFPVSFAPHGTSASCAQGTVLASKEFLNPVACLSHQRNVSCPMFRRKWKHQLFVRKFFFFFCTAHPSGPRANEALYPRIPHDWTADRIYTCQNRPNRRHLLRCYKSLLNSLPKKMASFWLILNTGAGCKKNVL